jgi:hypothetical protein
MQEPIYPKAVDVVRNVPCFRRAWRGVQTQTPTSFGHLHVTCLSPLRPPSQGWKVPNSSAWRAARSRPRAVPNICHGTLLGFHVYACGLALRLRHRQVAKNRPGYEDVSEADAQRRRTLHRQWIVACNIRDAGCVHAVVARCSKWRYR